MRACAPRGDAALARRLLVWPLPARERLVAGITKALQAAVPASACAAPGALCGARRARRGVAAPGRQPLHVADGAAAGHRGQSDLLDRAHAAALHRSEPAGAVPAPGPAHPALCTAQMPDQCRSGPLRGTSAWGTCPCPADHTFTPASTPSVANRREGAYPAPSWGPHAPAAAAACAWQGSSRACTAVERLAGL